MALKLLLKGGVTGVQALNEFAAVALRKMKATWPETCDWLELIEQLVSPLSRHPEPVRLNPNQRFSSGSRYFMAFLATI